MILPLFSNVDSQDFSRLEAVLGHSQGYNQAALPSMMSATNDCEAVKTFLADYRNTPLTYRSYLKEVERLVLWCLEVPKVTISDLKREHLTQYREFLSDPVPTKLWCGPRKPRMTEEGEVNPEWRPFVSGLSGPTIRKTMSILDSFFNYLVQNNYFAGNPLAVDKRRRGEKSRSTERWLERDEIVTTLQALDDYLIQYPNRPFEIIRAKYIILTLFYTGLRLAEITHHKMGDFVLIEGEWYLKVIGKGEKERKIVVVDEYLDILVNFRTLVGFKTKLPSYDEPIPLVPAQNMSPLTENRIWQILKWSFELGARKYEAMTTIDEETALKHQHKASKLRKASTHWLRHSYGTYLVKSGVSIEKVKELMGHSDISTTMIYVHIAKNDLHAQARGLSLAESSAIEDKT